MSAAPTAGLKSGNVDIGPLAQAIRGGRLPGIKLRLITEGKSFLRQAQREARAELDRICTECRILEINAVKEIYANFPYLVPLIKDVTAQLRNASSNHEGVVHFPNDFGTLQEAVNSGAGIIEVSTGVHSIASRLNISRPVCIRGPVGSSRDAVKLELAAVVVIDTNLPIDDKVDVELNGITLVSCGWDESSFRSVPGPLLDLKSGRVVIQACSIKHSGQKSSICVREAACGVFSKSFFDATVEVNGVGSFEGNEIVGCVSIGLSVTGGAKEVESGRTMLTTISGNKIEGCGGYGVWVRREANVALLNNEVRCCASDAICVEDRGTSASVSLNSLFECKGAGLTASAGACVTLSSNDIARAHNGGIVVTGKGTKASCILNRVFTCGGHGVLIFRGGDAQLEDNEVRMCEKAAVAVKDEGSNAIVCANQLIIPSPHSFKHIETDGKAGFVQYNNEVAVVGTVGKLTKEGALGVTIAVKRKEEPSDMMTSFKGRLNDYRYEAPTPGVAVPWPDNTVLRPGKR